MALLRSQIVDLLSVQLPQLRRIDVELLTNHILAQLSQTLADGRRIEVRGFGSFFLRHRPARHTRNPKTGEPAFVSGKEIPAFKPGKKLRERVMGKSACKGRSIRMDKLDGLVTQNLLQRLLTTERLTEMLKSIAEQRAVKATEVDGRVHALQTEVAEAQTKLKRLYQMVENGLTEVDETLKERIDALKQAQSVAQIALDRIRVRTLPPTVVPPALIEQFGQMMRDHLTHGEITFRRSYLRAIIDRIEVDERVIRVVGTKTALEHAITAQPGAMPGVQGFVRKWRANRDETANTYVLEFSK